ncbi:MAG TPA: hypothetical protein VN641_11665 [Urbifossiella sp.]|nr:hypothetical protein [Urbifossiella sp.]
MRFQSSVAFILIFTGTGLAADDAVTRSLAVLKSVDREGKNNEDAGTAWKALVAEGSAALFPTLAAIDDGQPIAANWLRLAARAIAESEVKAKRPLPAANLEGFAKDAKFAGSARAIAYEMLVAQDARAPERLLPGFLNDPSNELRRTAVAAELDKLKKRPSKAGFEKLLPFARDQDQVEAIAKKLDSDYQRKVNLNEHFALIAHWKVIGPFESKEGKALKIRHRPEDKVAFEEKLKGKGDKELAWTAFASREKYAWVDFNKALGKNHDAAGYAATVLIADKATQVEVRLGSPNALQVFLNGKKLFEREEYHHGATMDYHIGKGELKAGPNVLLVKICQNNQRDAWAQSWQFQARLCDASGAPLPGVLQAVADKKIKLGSVLDPK